MANQGMNGKSDNKRKPILIIVSFKFYRKISLLMVSYAYTQNYNHDTEILKDKIKRKEEIANNGHFDQRQLHPH